MSYTNTPIVDPGNSALPPSQEKQKNTIGLIALIVAAVGFVFACIPGALIIGWVLLPIGFILAIVSFFLKGKKKGLGVAALIVAIVGTIVGFVVFFTVVATAFDDAFSNGDTSVSVPEGSGVVEEVADENSRENPYPLGSVISDDEWELVVNSVNLDATEAVASANEFNDAAPAGEVYILANVTITYKGTDPSGAMPTQSIAYVTVEGNTVNSFDSFAVAPDALDSITTLYEGASTTGNVVLTAPAESVGQGVLAVSPSMFGEKVFVAVQ